MTVFPQEGHKKTWIAIAGLALTIILQGVGSIYQIGQFEGRVTAQIQTLQEDMRELRGIIVNHISRPEQPSISAGPPEPEVLWLKKPRKQK